MIVGVRYLVLLEICVFSLVIIVFRKQYVQQNSDCWLKLNIGPEIELILFIKLF